MAAKGFIERERVQDPNVADRGNAPSALLAVQGIMRPSGAPASKPSGVAGAINAFTDLANTLDRKKNNAAYIDGQMASAAGQTQDQVAATGNKTTMAGFVGVEVSNAVSEWAQTHTEQAATQHYNTDPAEYRKMLSTSSAELIAKMGGDDFAEAQLAKGLLPTLQQLGSTQAAAHAQYTMNETENAYTKSLMATGQAAASKYEGSTTNPTKAPSMGATAKAGGDYMAYAQGYVNKIINVESGGDPRAQAKTSSAGGLGQFIDSTWVATVRRYRKDLAGKSNAELIALKYNGKLNKEMTIAHTAQNARQLDAWGFAVTPGNSYLMHFAGSGGARRVLKGNPNASVATTMTPGQISANEKIMYKNGRLITNGELRAWAERKMGKAKSSLKVKGGQQPTQTYSANKNVQSNIMTNPGLPPEVHRRAVANAMILSLQQDDGSLYQTAGGLAGLDSLNLSAGETSKIMSAHKAFTQRRQNEYNSDYERQRSDIIEKASSGEYSEDAVFTMLDQLHDTYKRDDQEMKRTHGDVQKAIDTSSDEVKKSVWADPDRQLDLVEIRNDMEDGVLTPKQASDKIVELGELYGSDEATTAAAVATIMSAYDGMRKKDRTDASKAVAEGKKAQAKVAEAEALISRNILGTGTKDEQELGIAILESRLIKDLKAAGTPPHELPSKANAMMAKVLVQNDVTDLKRASVMRAAMMNPIGEDGKPTARAVESLAFFLDMKHDAGAPPEYLTRMFAGNEKTLELLLTAEGHMIGDTNLDGAIQMAWKQVNDPVTQARISTSQKKIKTGEFQSRVKEAILDNSGVTNTYWNNAMNMFNSNWNLERITPEGVDRIMQDTGLNLIIEGETRSATAAYPNATEDTIAAIVSGQMAERGAVIGGSFVISPPDTNMRSVMGLNSTEKDAPNSATKLFVRNNGEALFGKDVWADIGPTIMSDAFTGEQASFTVELIGDNMVITPAAARYAPDAPGFIFDRDNASLPEARAAIVRAKDVGNWYNKYQTTPGVVGKTLNKVIDLFN